MATAPTFLFIPPPFPLLPPDSPSDELSPLGLVVGFIAIITIPILIYTIVCVVKCPSLSLSRAGWSSTRYPVEISAVGGGGTAPSELNDKKESDHVADAVGSECPVCLSTLLEGEEIKRLSMCGHAFHGACIDLWLDSHPNCPVCRALVVVDRRSNPAPPPPPAAARPHQGFQHVADLV